MNIKSIKHLVKGYMMTRKGLKNYHKTYQNGEVCHWDKNSHIIYVTKEGRHEIKFVSVDETDKVHDTLGSYLIGFGKKFYRDSRVLCNYFSFWNRKGGSLDYDVVVGFGLLIVTGIILL